MAKIYLKIWLKVKENGTKKIKLAKMVAKEKKNPSANPGENDHRNYFMINLPAGIELAAS